MREVKLDISTYFVFATCLSIDLVAAPATDCGEQAPIGNCVHGCYVSCINGLGAATDPTAIEAVLTEKNLCKLHCKAAVYKPQMNYAPNRRPKYGDVSNCLYPCAYPMAEVCRKGYLSMFFYCDCYQCCAAKSPANAELCIAGCHEWYMKKWSSVGIDICRFNNDYKKTPVTWCLAFCTWKIVRAFGLTTSSIPDASEQVGACATKCKALLHNDIPVDYNTVVSRCPTNQYKCVTAIHVHGFTIIERNITGANFELSDDIGRRDILSPVVVNNTNNFTVPDLTDVAAEMEMSYKVSRPLGLQNMFNQGVKVHLDNNLESKVNMTLIRPSFVDILDVGRALARAFTFRPDSLITNSTNLTHTQRLQRLYVLDACTSFRKSVYAKHLRLQLTYEVNITVTDAEGIVPMSAENLQRGVAAKPDWREGMEYLGKRDAYSIDMKGTGTISLETWINPVMEVSCDLILNCEFDAAARNSQNPCRCAANCPV